MVAKLLYLAKRTKPECLTAVSFLATRVTRCTADDIGKLARLVRYIRRTKDRGVVLRPGLLGIRVRVFVDAAFGVHTDFRSHTGSCVVIGDTGAPRMPRPRRLSRGYRAVPVSAQRPCPSHA